MLSASKICVLPENICVHSRSSQIVNAKTSQLLTSTYENQSVNLNFKSLPDVKECLIMYIKVCEVVKKISLACGYECCQH